MSLDCLQQLQSGGQLLTNSDRTFFLFSCFKEIIQNKPGDFLDFQDDVDTPVVILKYVMYV